jgi:tryptophan synthase alpha chain
MPYSDPLADGPVIQNSSMKALQNGMTIKKLFQQLNNAKDEIKIPLILMGYLNPVLQFGFEKFCKEAKHAGISGIILPDLPISEYENEYQKIFEANGLNFIFLITPETSEERIRKIDSLSKGFIYAVSSSSVTGKNTDINAQKNYFKKIQNLHLKNQVLIGFGIRDHQTFQTAGKYSAGAIIGTAYIKAIENAQNIETATQKFLNSILNG